MEEEQQPIPANFEGYNDNFLPVPEMPSDLTRWQLSSEDILDKLEHSLRGEIWNEREQRYESKGQKLMNDEGIRSVLSIVESVVNKIAFLSNLEQDMIFMITRELGIDLIQLIHMKHNEYNIKAEHASLIVDKVTFLIYLGLQRAFMEGERKFLRTTEQRKYLIQENPKKEKKGFWIFGRGD